MARKQNRILPMDGIPHRQRSGGRLWLWLTMLLGAVVIAAYIDGGEEPLRPMTETVILPEST